MSKSADLFRRRQELGVALRELRESAGLSGSRLAARLGVSQSKVSKIETGLSRPSIEEVEIMLNALEASTEVRRKILKLAQVSPLSFTHMSAMRQVGLDRNQQNVGARERAALEYRNYSSTFISGLLQTPEFIRSLFVKPLFVGSINAQRMITARVDRQRILYEPGRHFRFLFSEAALRSRLCSGPVMAMQMDHIASMSRLDSVDISVLPWTTRIPQATLHHFTIYDERLVVVENMHGDLKVRDHKDIVMYAELFESLHGVAQHGDAAREFLREVADEHRGLPD
ncbi:helix-turn-helix transcriptional regulator [Longispora sp. NPDC051575]|uniref:helix-turn-helix domain-containing protein n=1 Tax=Longispora sp. NPDC051575 TaxID=3154943 RepID=UPI00341DFF59